MSARTDDQANATGDGDAHDSGSLQGMRATARRASPRALLIVAASIVVTPAEAQRTPPDIKTPLPKPLPTIRAPGKPPLKLTLPPRIAGVRLSAGSSGEYSSGAIRYDVEVVNPTGNPALEGALVLGLDGSGRSPVRVPAGGRAWIAIADASGLDHGCKKTLRSVELEGVDGASGRFTVTPSCQFSGEVIEPSASSPPDRKLALRQGKLYYHSMSSAGGLRCGESDERGRYEARQLEVAATIRNSAATTARDVRLRFRDARTSGAPGLELAAGQERRIRASAAFDADERDYVLEISGAGAPLYQPLSYVKTRRRCRLDVAF